MFMFEYNCTYCADKGLSSIADRSVSMSSLQDSLAERVCSGIGTCVSMGWGGFKTVCDVV